MPYTIEKEGSCFKVINKKTGKVHAKCTTKAKAEAQLHLLQGVEHGWEPSGKKAKNESISSEIKKLLDAGEKVRSGAAGRVGDIVAVDGNTITIKSAKTGKKGVTSFNTGDKVKLVKKDGFYAVVNECKDSNDRAGLEDFDETTLDMPKTKKKKKEVKESNVDKLLRVFEGKEVEEITEALDTKMKVGVKKAMEMMKKMYPTHKADWDKETLLFDVDGKLHGQWENGTLHYKFKKSEEK